MKSKLYVRCATFVLLMAPLTSYAWWESGTNLCDGWSDWNYELTGNGELSAGYRADKLSSSIDSFDSTGALVSTDKLKVKDIPVWEIGGKGVLALGNLYIRGHAYAGWGGYGKYSEDFSVGAVEVADSSAEVSHTRTFDALVGLGYMFEIDTGCSCSRFGIAPIAGWSFDSQRIKLEDGVTNNVDDPVFDGLVYKNRWNGPWLGVDISYSYCEFSVDFGYEYHWSNFHGEWLLDDVDTLPTAFSDRRRAKDAYGNVVYLDGYWNFACNWEVGLGVKLQQWNAKNGSVEPVADVGPIEALEIKDKLKHAQWSSAEVTLNLVYNF